MTLAIEANTDLVLVEDDILAAPSIWDAAFQVLDDHVLGMATAKCHNGQFNTHYDREGRVLYSGTVLVAVPFDILIRLPSPRFRPFDFYVDRQASTLIPREENRDGHHSDVWFWGQVRQLEPPVEIRVIGHVTHLLHPLSGGKHDLRNPCRIERLT